MFPLCPHLKQCTSSFTRKPTMKSNYQSYGVWLSEVRSLLGWSQIPGLARGDTGEEASAVSAPHWLLQFLMGKPGDPLKSEAPSSLPSSMHRKHCGQELHAPHRSTPHNLSPSEALPAPQGPWGHSQPLGVFSRTGEAHGPLVLKEVV